MNQPTSNAASLLGRLQKQIAAMQQINRDQRKKQERELELKQKGLK